MKGSFSKPLSIHTIFIFILRHIVQKSLIFLKLSQAPAAGSSFVVLLVLVHLVLLAELALGVVLAQELVPVVLLVLQQVGHDVAGDLLLLLGAARALALQRVGNYFCGKRNKQRSKAVRTGRRVRASTPRTLRPIPSQTGCFTLGH